MKRISIILLIIILLISGCSGEGDTVKGYTHIDQETAKEMMTRNDGHIIVDVRRPDEYESGHLPGAVLVPLESIGNEPPDALPDLEQIILIYCRRGNRSKQAAEKLAAMGYTNIFEFGGIEEWTGEIVTGNEEPEPEAWTSGITEFYYTYDPSTAAPVYQRYHFYTENGGYFFYHETREGGSWPQTEEDITVSGTVELSEEDWKSFRLLLSGGSVLEPSDDVTDGDAGPWTYVYRGRGQEEYSFPSYDARLAFVRFCEDLRDIRQ